MRIESIKLQNFRNIEWAELTFEGPQHFFIGANAQGKTNLLEALSLITALRSFRTHTDLKPLIKVGALQARLHFLIDHENLGNTELEIHLGKQSRHVFLDGQRLKSWADFLGKFVTVAFASADRQWVSGPPGGRRKWLDAIISCLDAQYFEALRRYSKALVARNRLLKTQGAANVLKAMDRVMAKDALTLVNARSEHIRNLSEIFFEVYLQLTGGHEKATMAYAPDSDAQTIQDFEALWLGHLSKDTVYGQTQKGPHRDDIIFEIESNAVRDFASEGQQRSTVLAMRLAQMLYMRSKLRVMPVLLADDILSELDEKRQRCFWRLIPEATQLFATATVKPLSVQAAQFWGVKLGQFSLLDL